MDTIKILVSSDNHVGYEERDAIRKDDSWKTFDEMMSIAKAREVDLVLLAGDLFHDNRPSRQCMYQVMRSLRAHCLGERPCQVEFVGHAPDVFDGAFPHVNYEDLDINISIPVFSIHGNHDDPSGDGHLCSLDLLQCAGLVNYYGRATQGDRIDVRPVLLRKGATSLALYGLGNVRDERLFRTFRDGAVRWFRPANAAPDTATAGDADQPGWFSLLAVHQNRHAHTATSYLPEEVLPDWLDLVVWGHEHECLIEPTRNPATGFHLMQPGSTVATSLVPGEAVRKHVAILTVTGRDFHVEPVPLRTVRPFVTRDLVLAHDFPGLGRDNRQEITRRLMATVDEMIAEALTEWHSVNDDDLAHPTTTTTAGAASPPAAPLPLIRLRVECSTADGGRYDCENPQRFSNRFVGRVANVNDVVYFYRRKKGQTKQVGVEMPESTVVDALGEVKVETLVREFLAAQSLKILPRAPFGDAVEQFVTKDDRTAMETFVAESLADQVKQMLALDSDPEDDRTGGDGAVLERAMDRFRQAQEDRFVAAGAAAAARRNRRRRALRQRPSSWDSDLDGHWDDQPSVWGEYEDVGAASGGGDDGLFITAADEDDDEPAAIVPPPAVVASGLSKARQRKPPAARAARGGSSTRATTSRATSARATRRTRAAATAAKKRNTIEISEDEISE